MPYLLVVLGNPSKYTFMVSSDGCHVHRIHGDVEGIGGLLKQYHVPLAITEVTGGDCTTLAPTYKLNMTDEF